MMAQNPEDSYNLAEEIAVRALFKTKRPEYLADTFTVIYHELKNDIHAQARLVDIGLRYEKNIPLNLAAARKIAYLLDEHKILLIPAHIDLAPPEVAEAIAKQIHTIRSDDPRRYFFERWSVHENAAVSRICRAGRASFRESNRVFATEARRTPTLLLAPEKQKAPVRIYAPTTSAAPKAAAAMTVTTAVSPTKIVGVQRYISSRVDRTVASITKQSNPKLTETTRKPKPPQVSGAQVSGAHNAVRSADLIGLIALHLNDSHWQIRLKWLKETGQIPTHLDADDMHKIRFITQGLKDPTSAVCLEAVAQIAFLLHDKSKLALLLLLIEVQSDLLRTAEAQLVIGSLSPENQKKLKDAHDSKNNSMRYRKTGTGVMTESRKSGEKDQSSTAITVSSAENVQSKAGATEKFSKETATTKRVDTTRVSKQSAEKTRFAESGMTDIPTITGDKSRTTGLLASDERSATSEIIVELDLPQAAFDEHENDGNSLSALIRELAPVSGEDRTDNYFLRHAAVLHIKDLHTEEVRFQLYLAVLRHDAKDIVRQIAVQESKNLEEAHILEMLRQGLKDRAWQVRCAVLDFLLPFMPDAVERTNILRACATDSDYHVRQKVTQKQAGLTDVKRLLK